MILFNSINTYCVVCIRHTIFGSTIPIITVCPFALSPSFFFLWCPLRSGPSSSNNHHASFVVLIRCYTCPNVRSPPSAFVSLAYLHLHFAHYFDTTHLSMHPLSPLITHTSAPFVAHFRYFSHGFQKLTFKS